MPMKTKFKTMLLLLVLCLTVTTTTYAAPKRTVTVKKVKLTRPKKPTAKQSSDTIIMTTKNAKAKYEFQYATNKSMKKLFPRKQQNHSVNSNRHQTQRIISVFGHTKNRLAKHTTVNGLTNVKLQPKRTIHQSHHLLHQIPSLIIQSQ